MFRDEKLELKVGLFIGVGIFLMFMIVFSVSDLYLLKKGYNVDVIFNFVNGIKANAPIRLAGVNVGEVKEITIFYDEVAESTRVKLNVRIADEAKVESDAVARINTLGLLGEQYLEITPGKSTRFLASGDTIDGKDPVNVGRQMERMSEFLVNVNKVMKHVGEGEGTIGKLLMDDTIYNDLEVIFGRLRKGEGTIGKLLVDETVYNDIEEFTADIKAHPWKLLKKTTDTKKKTDTKKRGTTID